VSLSALASDKGLLQRACQSVTLSRSVDMSNQTVILTRSSGLQYRCTTLKVRLEVVSNGAIRWDIMSLPIGDL